MGLLNRLAVGALGVGEFAVKVAWDTGSTLVNESQKAYSNYQVEKTATNAALNIANALFTTTVAGATSAFENGIEVGTRCYNEIQDDYANDEKLRLEAENAKQIEQKNKHNSDYSTYGDGDWTDGGIWR